MDKIKLEFNYSAFCSNFNTIESDTTFLFDIMNNKFRLTTYQKNFHNKELKNSYMENLPNIQIFKKESDLLICKKEYYNNFYSTLGELILDYFLFQATNRIKDNVLFRAEIEVKNEITNHYEFLFDIQVKDFWLLNVTSHIESRYELIKDVKFYTHRFYLESNYFNNFTNKLDNEIFSYLKEKRCISIEYFMEKFFPQESKNLFETMQKICNSIYLFDITEFNARQTYNNLVKLNKIIQILLENNLLPTPKNYEDLIYKLENMLFIANNSMFGDGSYQSKSKTISIFNIDSQDEVDLRFLEHTFIHEFGHYIDFYLTDTKKEDYLKIRENQLGIILDSDYGHLLINNKEYANSKKELRKANYLLKDTELIAENYFGLVIKNKLLENTKYHENINLKRYLDFSPQYIYNLCLNEYQKNIQEYFEIN